MEPLLTTMVRYCLLIVLTQTKLHEVELRFKKPQFSRQLRCRFQREHLLESQTVFSLKISTPKRALQKRGGINCKSKQKLTRKKSNVNDFKVIFRSRLCCRFPSSRNLTLFL